MLGPIRLMNMASLRSKKVRFIYASFIKCAFDIVFDIKDVYSLKIHQCTFVRVSYAESACLKYSRRQPIPVYMFMT